MMNTLCQMAPECLWCLLLLHCSRPHSLSWAPRLASAHWLHISRSEIFLSAASTDKQTTLAFALAMECEQFHLQTVIIRCCIRGKQKGTAITQNLRRRQAYSSAVSRRTAEMLLQLVAPLGEVVLGRIAQFGDANSDSIECIQALGTHPDHSALRGKVEGPGKSSTSVRNYITKWWSSLKKNSNRTSHHI